MKIRNTEMIVVSRRTWFYDSHQLKTDVIHDSQEILFDIFKIWSKDHRWLRLNFWRWIFVTVILISESTWSSLIILDRIFQNDSLKYVSSIFDIYFNFFRSKNNEIIRKYIFSNFSKYLISIIPTLEYFPTHHQSKTISLISMTCVSSDLKKILTKFVPWAHDDKNE